MEGQAQHRDSTTFDNYVISLQGWASACGHFDWWDGGYDVINCRFKRTVPSQKLAGDEGTFHKLLDGRLH